MERWTINKLNNLSDLRFAQCILNERLNRLSQTYSPLATKLRSAASKLDGLAAEEEAEAEKQSKQYMSYEEVFDALEWDCTKCDDGTLELSKHSPAGEDFNFVIDGKDICREIAEYAYDFDIDDHVDLWAEHRGTRGVPETFRELVEDAESIQEMLDELAEALNSVQTNCKKGTYDCATCAIHGSCGREEEENEDDE